MQKGLIHFYYGDGKGKTTAALGLALRALGSNKNVVLIQFLKDWQCGEIQALTHLPNISVLRGKSSRGNFVFEMTDEEKRETLSIHNENLKTALEIQRSGKCDLLILDEVVDAYSLGLLDKELFENLLNNKPKSLELILTGHKLNDFVCEQADYVTNMQKVKHPFDIGVPARKGIEF